MYDWEWVWGMAGRIGNYTPSNQSVFCLRIHDNSITYAPVEPQNVWSTKNVIVRLTTELHASARQRSLQQLGIQSQLIGPHVGRAMGKPRYIFSYMDSTHPVVLLGFIIILLLFIWLAICNNV